MIGGDPLPRPLRGERQPRRPPPFLWLSARLQLLPEPPGAGIRKEVPLCPTSGLKREELAANQERRARRGR